MKVLAIMGSPRKGKNNDKLLDRMLIGVREVNKEAEIEKLYAGEMTISPCVACDACTKIRGCVKKDDSNELIEKFNVADIIILTSPMYFNSISAQLKLVIDRNQAIWSSKYTLNDPLIDRNKKRIGFLICTAGASQHPFGMEAVTPIMDLFFKSINTEYKGSLFINNVDEKPAYENEVALNQAYEFGRGLSRSFSSF